VANIHVDIRRGAIITFVAAWIVQPWQLINRATTFITVLSSFSVFLAPIIGIMTCDYYILRRRRIRLSHLYRTQDSSYMFWKGLNWRTIPAWICGWAPTVGGLIVSVRGDLNPPRVLLQLYYMAFLIGQYMRVLTVCTATDYYDRLLHQCCVILCIEPLFPGNEHGSDRPSRPIRHFYRD
jgi:NCS1 family nucleobase:cation symporter-1